LGHASPEGLFKRFLGAFFINSPNNEEWIMSKTPLGTTARTGEKCPESGVWEVVGSPSTTAPIAQGNIMPPYAGKAVVWKLIQYA
jgi:hypothetical protein